MSPLAGSCAAFWSSSFAGSSSSSAHETPRYLAWSSTPDRPAEGEHEDGWRHAQAKRQVAGPDSGRHEQMSATFDHQATGVALAIGRRDNRRPKEWQTD